jgi:hypothetical protein
MKYSVGQVIYAVLNKKAQIYPLLVVEEIIKKTIKGEATNYIVQTGAEASSTSNLEQIEGEFFDNPAEAKKVLTQRATSQIERVVENAILKANEWYKNSHQTTDEEIHELPPSKSTLEQTITLPDGTVARIKLPAGE